MKKCYSIGVDLGTTNTCMGFFERDDVEIINNDRGNPTTPSVVSVSLPNPISESESESESEYEILIGEDAVDNGGINPKNTICNVKRIMGRDFNDKELQLDMKHWPFKVVEKKNGKPYIRMNLGYEIKDYSPEEISSMILLKMKECAESYLGHEVTDAVITVPAFFNDAQRRATKDAGEIAGLRVQRIVNEPTAAAIAYGFNKIRSNDKTNILVVDIGGGTLDVSLLTVNNGKYEVIATVGDTHLGGVDFDNRLVDYFVKEFKMKYNKDLTTSPRAINRLKKKCENLKCGLSSKKVGKLSIDSLYDGIDFSTSLTRATFEELNIDLFKRVLDPIKVVIKDSGISKSNIHEIILVGGSSRIPKIQSLISDFFDGRDLCKNINPDEAVAYGAALLSAALSGVDSDKVRNLKLLDVTPISIGFRTTGGVMRKVIKRNTRVPTSETEIFTTKLDNQTKIKIRVYEGEHPYTKDNNLLGEFWLTDIPPAPHGVPKILQTIRIDENGILNVSAVDTSTGNSNAITIVNDKNRLSREEIEQIIKDNEKNKEKNRKENARIEAKNDFENCVFNLRSLLKNPNIKSKIEPNKYNMLLDYINSLLKWSYDHPNAKQKEYEKNISKLNKIISQILNLKNYN